MLITELVILNITFDICNIILVVESDVTYIERDVQGRESAFYGYISKGPIYLNGKYSVTFTSCTVLTYLGSERDDYLGCRNIYGCKQL